ncbi:MAG: polysaccharide biosynthesis/export family protein [Desulfovermiculus sp.]|nr:polysaccharide biosynthesis/export family protein [Desulfovermiculus sp.]
MLFSAMGCATSGPSSTKDLDQLLSEQGAQKQEIQELNDQLFATAGGAPQVAEALLGPGDLIQVNVFDADKLCTEARVGARGNVTLPLLGSINVEGLTIQDAEQRIEDLYAQDYLQDPNVTMFVKEQYGSKISVLGSVEKPGTFDYYGRQRLLDVLALAGGLKENAGRQVQIRRSSDDSQRPEKYLVDMHKLIREGKASLNLVIKGGDVVYVPEAGTVYVDGAVRKPGNYSIQEGMTAQEAIVAAGGFSTIADQKEIKLVRMTDSGQKEVVALDEDDLQKGAATQIEVQDRDIVFVETDAMKSFVYGMRLNIGTGLLGMGYSPPAK